ncbi:MAG: phosphoribosylformylglycinamidine cyclo-ligase [Clostridiales Family XIII bacterium]|jgi:phosphoribosylformylglycinamidine cyclo-ligase|nr:phosphoribosylformylglycinamidine cyclo-ligase [Clostridiales Family XIII bacterium]
MNHGVTDDKLTYKDAGVDTKEGERAVKLMKDHVKRTFDKGVLTGLGSFGSLYLPDLTGMEAPVLVAGSDGVGTKLMLAFAMDKHDTVGQDCVAMCVNDVLCQGAKPLFFQDYIATGYVNAEKVAGIVKGVADGCVLGRCSLVGGETAEMPGLYSDGEYDMAGFCVGIVDKKRIIDGSTIKEGDKIIGIESSGVHSNGFSLVRKVFFDKAGLSPFDTIPELDRPVGEVLLEPTRIYTVQVQALQEKVNIKGMVHITGGGFYENIPRVMPSGLGAKIQKNSWTRPDIFGAIMKYGNIDEKEMFKTFNMGIGLIFVVSPEDVEKTMDTLLTVGEDPTVIGEVALGEGVNIW